MLVPVICFAISLYFGYSGIFGERGLIAWSNDQAQLETAKRDLSEVRTEREALQHRISLLDDKAIDPDLLEEVARGVLLENRPDEVAVPREKH
ncbi:MAG TPA: septum formation initiator family protein [Micropepsaceae bacterium]|jgi:cell division protein FtsB|nr:septum formation initiator family protein [Micropepsaceae bacterium]